MLSMLQHSGFLKGPGRRDVPDQWETQQGKGLLASERGTFSTSVKNAKSKSSAIEDQTIFPYLEPYPGQKTTIPSSR